MRLVITMDGTWIKNLINEYAFQIFSNHFNSPYGKSTFLNLKKLIYQNCCSIIVRQFYQTSNHVIIVYAHARAISLQHDVDV